MLTFISFTLNIMFAGDSTKTKSNQDLPIIGKPNKHILNIQDWEMF